MFRTHAPRKIRNLDEDWTACALEGNRYYPKSMMVKYNGEWYCEDCFRFRYGRQLREESTIDYQELEEIE